MHKNGFTFLEILIVLFIVGTLTILTIGSFSYTQKAHQVDTLVQELALLRSAIISYKEMHGQLPQIGLSDLSSADFEALKPFWHPFHPENSKVIQGGKWYGKIDDSSEFETFLILKKGEQTLEFDIGLLEKKLHNLCGIDPSGEKFYILEYPWPQPK